MNRRIILLIFLGILAVLIAGCVQEKGAQPSQPSQTSQPAQTTKPVTSIAPGEGYTSLKELAEKIRKGEIDVGNDYTMTLNGRFHRIHNKVLGLDCSACHVSSSYAKDFLYQRKYKVPVRSAPGVVDRGVCLGCHKEGGIATPWYGTASE